jgi:hypothetical protein
MRIKWSKREEEFLKDSFYDMLSGTVPMSSKNLAFAPRALTHLLFNVKKLSNKQVMDKLQAMKRAF